MSTLLANTDGEVSCSNLTGAISGLSHKTVRAQANTADLMPSTQAIKNCNKDNYYPGNNMQTEMEDRKLNLIIKGDQHMYKMNFKILRQYKETFT